MLKKRAILIHSRRGVEILQDEGHHDLFLVVNKKITSDFDYIFVEFRLEIWYFIIIYLENLT